MAGLDVFRHSCSTAEGLVEKLPKSQYVKSWGPWVDGTERNMQVIGSPFHKAPLQGPESAFFFNSFFFTVTFSILNP